MAAAGRTGHRRKQPGTARSGGTHEAIQNPPTDGATLVHMGLSYVHTRRRHSRDFLVQAFNRLKRRFGAERFEGMEVTELGGLIGGNAIIGPYSSQSTNDLLHRECRRASSDTSERCRLDG